MKFLDIGVFYIHGRDNRFRPITVLNGAKIDPSNYDNDPDLIIDAITYHLEYQLHHFLLPGQVENWIYIMDLEGMGITTLPYSIINRVLKFLQNNYRSRLYVCYIVNSPMTVYIPWKIVKQFLAENTVKKMKFCKSLPVPEMFEHINPEQLEKKFGGRVPNKTGNFWPPTMPSTNYFLETEESEKILITSEEYQNKYNEGRLKENQICKELIPDAPEKTTIEVNSKIEVKDEGNIEGNSPQPDSPEVKDPLGEAMEKPTEEVEVKNS